MGLDITAYSKIRRAPTPRKTPDGAEWDGDTTSFYIVDGFESHAGDVVSVVPYYYGDSHSFRAGSYGGYNAWRRELAALVGTTDKEVWEKAEQGDLSGPFAMLINFSDCEGVIAGQAAKTLFADFQKYDEKAKATCTGDFDGNYFYERYKDWTKAFELAADDGAVSFH
jgi:hypothetical protein